MKKKFLFILIFLIGSSILYAMPKFWSYFTDNITTHQKPGVPIDNNLLSGLDEIEKKNYSNAIQFCDLAVKKSPDNKPANLCLIRALILDGSYDKADDRLELYEKKYGSDRLFLIEKARYETMMDHYDNALNIVNDLLKTDPSNETLLDIKQFILEKK